MSMSEFVNRFCFLYLELGVLLDTCDDYCLRHNTKYGLSLSRNEA